MVSPDQSSRKYVDNQPRKPLGARTSEFRYDRNCRLLSWTILFWNYSDHPVYLVADDFVFIGELSDLRQRMLSIQKESGKLVLDVSWPPPSPRLRELIETTTEGGGIPQTIRIDAQGFLYVTYVFKFPLALHPWYADEGHFTPPRGAQRLCIRYGYGTEPMGEFSVRETPGENELAHLERMIRQWQRTDESDVIQVDFD
jgi:hypothetical protein